MGRFAADVVAGWIDQMESADKWLSPVFADPLATSSPLSTEVVGDLLVRVLGDWVRTGPGALTLTSGLSFPGLPAGSHVAGLAGWDAAYNGKLLFADLLEVPADFPNGGTYTLPGGELVIGIDVPGA